MLFPPSLPCVFLQQQGNRAADAVAAMVHTHNTNDSISQPDMTVTAFNDLLRSCFCAAKGESYHAICIAENEQGILVLAGV